MSLRKFPVTAPDGTEFRISIDEWNETLVGPCVCASVYLPRKRWGFRKVHALTLYSYRGDYDPDDLEYVNLAREAVADYYAYVKADEEYQRAIRRKTAAREAAAKRFAEWDGRLTE